MNQPSTSLVNDGARPLDSVEQDYGNAVVHLAWAQLHDKQAPILLFGWVELLPVEVPPPPNCATERRPIATGAWVAVAHVVTKISAALDWYRCVREGQATTVDDKGQWTIALSISAPYDEEPTWPSMVCDSSEVPFVPCCWGYPRVHHLLPASQTLLDIESMEEQAKACLIDFISSRFHFPFDEYPEYLGSVHLVAPNPIFRELHQKLHPNRDELWVRLEPRAGHSEAQLSISVREGRPTGAVCHLGTVTGSECLRFPLAGKAQTVSIQVIDDKRGLLFDEPPSVFLQGVSTTMFMVSPRIVNTPSDSYEVPVRGEPMKYHTGEYQTKSSGAQRLYSAASARRERQAAESSDQYWLESREQALKVVRGLIHQANSEIFLVDAWFSRLDLITFVLALGGTRTTVKVLCGSSVHTTKSNSTKAKLHQEDKRALYQEITGLKSKGIHNQFDVRVMRGRKKPRIHDRFLICDGQVWSLGSSLNHLGERESVVVRLPAPEPVCERIHAIWERAIALEDWLGSLQESELA